jgi:hypothetical protein
MEDEPRPAPEKQARLDRRFEEMYGTDFASNLTNEERTGLLEELDQLKQLLREGLSNSGARVEERLQQLAGDHFSVMMQSAQDAEQYLESADPSLREAALSVLYRRWGQRDRYADRYERMAMCDPSEDVRRLAFTFLGSCFSYSCDPRISALLASVVLSCNEPTSLRMASYRALLCCHGYPIEAGKAFPLMFPDDVNWDFVNSLSQSQSARGEV